MLSEVELVDWINQMASSSLKTIDDAYTGKELLFILIKLTDNNDAISQIKEGHTSLERNKNFQTIRRLLQQNGVDADFQIKNAVEGNTNELLKIARIVWNFEKTLNEEEDDEYEDPDEIEALLDRCEDELSAKIEALKRKKDDIDEIALERNFYFDKLLQIEQVTKGKPDCIKVEMVYTNIPKEMEEVE